MDKSNINLNAPAFGPGSQTLESLTETNTSVEEQQEVKEEVENEVDTSVEENKVPYSRFKNVHQAKIDAEAEAEHWRLKAVELEQNRSRSNFGEEDSVEMPSYWKELYGDSDASEKAWYIQQKREQEIEQRAYEAGQRGALELEQRQRERIDSNVSTIDSNFESLSDYIGRDISSKEQSAVLDIVDEFTAKDENGNYQGALMPFDKAWDIYEMKQNSSKQSSRQSRDNVAALSGQSSQGDVSSQEEKDKNWNPLARGSWRSRL